MKLKDEIDKQIDSGYIESGYYGILDRYIKKNKMLGNVCAVNEEGEFSWESEYTDEFMRQHVRINENMATLTIPRQAVLLGRSLYALLGRLASKGYDLTIEGGENMIDCMRGTVLAAGNDVCINIKNSIGLHKLMLYAYIKPAATVYLECNRMERSAAVCLVSMHITDEFNIVPRNDLLYSTFMEAVKDSTKGEVIEADETLEEQYGIDSRYVRWEEYSRSGGIFDDSYVDWNDYANSGSINIMRKVKDIISEALCVEGYITSSGKMSDSLTVKVESRSLKTGTMENIINDTYGSGHAFKKAMEAVLNDTYNRKLDSLFGREKGLTARKAVKEYMQTRAVDMLNIGIIVFWKDVDIKEGTAEKIKIRCSVYRGMSETGCFIAVRTGLYTADENDTEIASFGYRDINSTAQLLSEDIILNMVIRCKQT